MSLPYMTSSSFTLILFIGLFRHNYRSFSRTTVCIWLFCFKYLLSFYCISILIAMFWFNFWKLFLLFQNRFTKNKPLYTDLQLLMQCKCCNFHHGLPLTATHYIVCCYTACLIIQPLRPRFTLLWLFRLIRCRHCCGHSFWESNFGNGLVGRNPSGHYHLTPSERSRRGWSVLYANFTSYSSS